MKKQQNIYRSLKRYYSFLKLIRQINLVSFTRINLFKKFPGWFIPYRRGSCSIHREAEIIVNEGATFRFNRGEPSDPFVGYFKMEAGAKLIVNDSFSIHAGSRVRIFKNATLELGSGYVNFGAFLSCRDRITIGKGATIANNVIIRDHDAHEIIGEHRPSVQPVEIGNHVWIGTNVTILKGVKIGDGAIIAANSLVNKDIPAKALAGGVPAKILRENVDWK